MLTTCKRIIACLLTCGLMTIPATAGELIDAVAATVDREVILQSDLVTEIGPLLETLRTSAATQEEFDRQVEEALRDALDQAVEQKILYREALLAGVEVTDEDIDDRLRQIKAQYESNDAFMRVVEQAGESMGDFRERLRKQIMAITMGVGKRRMFEDEAVISESEMAQYYQDNIDQFSRPERVKVRRIFLPASGDDLARAEAQLQALKEEISLGADFAGLAQAHSKGPSAEEGGLIGWVQRGDLVPQLEDVIFQMSAGDVSPVVLTDFGAQLLMVEEKQEAGQASFEEVRTEIEPILREQYADERYEKWMNELRKRSRVNIYL